MSFLNIKDPSKRAALVNEYVTAMKMVKTVNREMKLAMETNCKLFSTQLSMRRNKRLKRLGKSSDQ